MPPLEASMEQEPLLEETTAEEKPKRKRRSTGKALVDQTTTAEILRSQPKVNVTFQQRTDTMTPPEVFAGINGYCYKYTRGVPVDVSVDVLKVIQASIETKYNLIKDANGIQRREPYQVPRYPFTINSGQEHMKESK